MNPSLLDSVRVVKDWMSLGEGMDKRMSKSTLGRRDIPKGQIRWLMSRVHVSATEEEIQEDILSRSVKWPQEAREEAVRYALKCHRENQGLYTAVVTGRF